MSPCVLRNVAAIGAAVFLLSACSSESQTTTLGLPPNTVDVHRARPSNVQHVLYVSQIQYSAPVNVLKYGTWANLGGISNGVNYANDLWVDKNQSLYVANDNGGVTEYNSAGDLIFTYSNGGRTIRGVTTDASGNVYTSGNNGATEFTQLSNTPIKMCNPGNEAGGVAVDTHGNVFVTMEFASRIMEYPRGLKASHCNGTVLPVAPTQVMGLAIDKQNDLVLCQGPNYPPDIIAPPYTSVTKTLGTGNCWNVTIDSTGTRAYLADYFAETINVLTYPGGSKVASICCFGDATAAVDSRNYVP